MTTIPEQVQAQLDAPFERLAGLDPLSRIFLEEENTMPTTVIRRKSTPAPAVRSLPELVDEYMRQLAQRDKSPATKRTYLYVLNAYLNAFDKRDVTTITLNEVETWCLRPRRTEVTNMTLRKDAVIVRGFHQWLIERGVAAHPLRTLKFGKLNRTTPRPVEDDVWMRVWSSDLDDMDRLWLGLGYFAGLRRLEIIQLRPQDVSLDKGELLFARKGGFHANVEFQACHSVLASRLPHLAGDYDWPGLVQGHTRRRLQLDATWLWPDTEAGDETDCNRLNKRCVKLTRRLDLPDGALTPHRLRHSCATNLLRCGLPIEVIQRQLAHSSIDITQRYIQMAGEVAKHARHNATE